MSEEQDPEVVYQVDVPFDMTLENVYAGMLAIGVILSQIIPDFDTLFSQIAASLTVAIKEGKIGSEESTN